MTRASRTNLLARYYPEAEFGGYTNGCPDTQFLLRVRSLLSPDTVTLDLGCGRGIDESTAAMSNLKTLKGACRQVIGIDVEPGAGTNPRIDEFRLIDGPRWPIDDASIDLMMCRYVLEHVESPSTFFEECARVLRPDGIACFLTSNVISYFGAAARLIPNRLHAKVVKFSHPTSVRQEQDIFPTYYRCNSIWRLRRQLRTAGFDASVFGLGGPPNYLEFSKFVYPLGVAYQRLMPSCFQPSLLAFARKLD